MRRPIQLLLMFFLIAAMIAPLLVAQRNVSDDRIYDEVRRRLADDPDIKGAAIGVDVKNGAVTLKGIIPDVLAREKATKIVKKVKGVTTVDNQLKLFSEN